MVKKAKKTPEFNLNMLQVFKKVEVTIPFLDVIQQIPKYAKFLKDLCTHKDRIGELETLSLGSSISSLMKPIPNVVTLGLVWCLVVLVDALFMIVYVTLELV
ncbi:hypothetical protein AHAS_Ahas03G0244900 [Arachis hypogaea]